MPLEPDADLAWAAYLYATGELSDVEEAAFEGRLAEDQAAREAVARAVELAGALSSVGSEAWARPSGRRSRSRRALAWSAFATAASLVLAGLWGFRSSPAIAPDASEVAIAWSGLRHLEATGGEVEPWALADDPHPAVDLDAPTEPALPSWLLTAAGPRDDSPREEN